MPVISLDASCAPPVAAVSNGAAVLGLGSGADAAKPVMEGEIGLFKRFADIDRIDLEIRSKDIDPVVNAVEVFSTFKAACVGSLLNAEHVLWREVTSE